MDVGGWLRSLGLGQYEALFRASEIEADILPELTEIDLEKLGVPLVHRKRLLRAISGLAAAETSAAPAAPTGQKPQDAAERRQLTVMFCDLVGSTALSVRFDPEDLRKIIGAYHRCVTEIAEGFGGFVARYMGDGVLVYFGYPRAHEDGAERATRCGLALVERVAPSRPDLLPSPIKPGTLSKISGVSPVTGAADNSPIFWNLLCDMAVAEPAVSANPRVPARPHPQLLHSCTARYHQRRRVASCFLRFKLRTRSLGIVGNFDPKTCRNLSRAHRPAENDLGYWRPGPLKLEDRHKVRISAD